MRVIAGTLRGRKLCAPAGDETRPITDRAKQSLFDILAPLIPGARVYDLFAGTGSMGIECLSRGADHATFFELGRSAVDGLKANLASFGLEKQSTIVRGDLFGWFAKAAAPAGRINLVFLDPPYRFVADRPQKLKQLAEKLRAHLSDEGLVVFRHDARDHLELPALARYDRRQYGGMIIELLQAAS